MAAVTRTVTPDFAGLREVGDVLGVVARPRDVFLPVLQRGGDGAQRLAAQTVDANLFPSGLAHAGHGAHRNDDVFRVGDLHAQLGVVGTERAHAERHPPHGAAAHATAVQV